MESIRGCLATTIYKVIYLHLGGLGDDNYCCGLEFDLLIFARDHSFPICIFICACLN